jgi:hypothetical protein
MNSSRRVSMLLLALGLVLLAACNEDPTRPATGLISVTVKDVLGPPVADVEVRIVPLGLDAMTNARGRALFEVAPGDYFVDASLCCQGPGFIEYHVPVTVTAGESEAVELRSCLACQ